MEREQIARPPAGRQTLFVIICGGIVAAGLLLACIVLPAEYGIDPLGTGKALGLTGLAQTSERIATSRTTETTDTGKTTGTATATGTAETIAATAAATVAEATIAPVLQPEQVESRWGEEAAVTGAFIAQPERFRLDSREITLGPFEGMEIKYHMGKGAGLVYSWTTSAPVLYDFHGQPDVARPDAPPSDEEYFESYDRGDVSGKSEFHGTLVAPSTGIEGWFWENTSGDVVKIKLVAAGFFDWVYQNRNEEKTRLKPTDAYSLPSHPQVPDEPL